MIGRAATAMLLVVLLPAASAFDSLPGGPHDDITKAAALAAGYPESGIAALVEAVRAPDLRDNKPDPDLDDLLSFDVTDEYLPRHHCDRVPPETDAVAFQATVAYVREQRDAAHAASLASDPRQTVGSLGNALHAIEDCFSHSNAVDLADPGSLVRALASDGPPPPGLRLTAFLPGADDPERPPGHPYAHGDFAKDSEQKNDEAKALGPDGRTKFVAARALAEEAATLFLRGWVGNATGSGLQALGDLEAADGSEGAAWGIPAAPAGVLALTLVLLAVTGHRRDRDR